MFPKSYFFWTLILLNHLQSKITGSDKEGEVILFYLLVKIEFICDNDDREAMASFRWDWSGLPCLVQPLTLLHVSEYRNFWNRKDGSL